MVDLLRPFDFTNNRYVALLSLSNYHYVTAEQVPGAFGTDRPLIANRTRVPDWVVADRPPWEAFQVIENQDGSIVLKAMINNEYVIAEDAGRGALTARSTAIQPIQDHPWSKYTVVAAPSGVFLRARINNKYVTSANRGNGPSSPAQPRPARGRRSTWSSSATWALRASGTSPSSHTPTSDTSPRRTLAMSRSGPAATVIEPLNDHHWEIFELASHPLGGCSLKAFVNKKYVMAANEGNDPLIAARDKEPASTWEQFDLIAWNTTIRPC